MKKKLLTLIVSFCLSCTFLYAQNQSSIGVFPTLDLSSKISDKLTLGLYYFGAFNAKNYQFNNSNEDVNFLMLYGEQSLTYNVDTNFSLTGSYVYQRTFPTKNYAVNENRFYLQSTYSYHHKSLVLKHRLRYDGRFITNNLTNETPYTSRIRYLVGLKKELKNDFYINAYNEFFFNTYKKRKVIYNENWMYLGIGKKLNQNNSIEMGPLYIFWVNDNSVDLWNLCYLQFTWNTSLNLKK